MMEFISYVYLTNIQSVNAMIGFDVLAAVFAYSSKHIKIDSIKQTMNWNWSCASGDNAGCVYDLNHSY